MLVIPPAEDYQQGFDRYWRMRFMHDFGRVRARELRRRLLAMGCHVRSDMLKYGLERRAENLLSGGIAYDSCEEAELAKFIRDRGLKAPTDMPIYKMINTLENADKTRPFFYFQDLPPELREQIIKYYVQEFATVLHCPVAPPLARSSALVCREVMPVFFEHCQVVLHFQRLRYRGPFKPSDDTFMWLKTIRPEYFKTLRRLVAVFKEQLPGIPHQVGNVRIEWARTTRTYQVEFEGFKPKRMRDPIVTEPLDIGEELDVGLIYCARNYVEKKLSLVDDYK